MAIRYKDNESERTPAPEDSSQIRELTDFLMAQVDSQISSPQERTLKIHRLLQGKVNDWDMICFSVEFLGLMSQSYPWLEQPAKSLSRLVYTAHYNGYFSEDNETLKRDTESGRKVFLSRSGGSTKDSNEGEEDTGK